jgi:RNA polymerase sigma-B factor
MLVHIVSHPRTNRSRLPRAALRRMAEALSRAGADVRIDTRAFPGTDQGSAIADCTDLLARRWRERRPDVVLTFGIVATSAAVALEQEVTVVATFDEHPEDAEVQRQLAERVTAVLPLSTAEHERWRRLGVPTLSAGVFPAPLDVPDPDAGPCVGGLVVTFEDGPLLEALIAGLPQWDGAGLVLAGRLAPQRWDALRLAAQRVGVTNRVRYQPGLRGARRASMWARASVLVAGPQGARHGGHVLEAAAHGVPAVATAQWAHLDHVVAGTTGILVESDERAVIRAAGSLLADPFQLRALGRAALVRAQSAHDPALSGERLLTLLKQVADSGRATAAPADAGRHDAHPDESAAHDRSASGDEPSGSAEEQVDREALALAHLPLARQLAGWYGGRGQSRDELVQVAYLGLVLAAERYDPGHGRPFHSFAVPTILGELRRHFRDHAWAVRIPRSLQETVLQVRQAADDLAPVLGHTATPAELAECIDATEQDVLAALRADSEARHIGSMDHAPGSPMVGERIGSVDPGHDLAEAREDLRAVLRRLPEREQQVLLLRFHAELTQSEIAGRLGISQVHVSRLLSRTLATIREHLLDDAPLPDTWQAAQAS